MSYQRVAAGCKDTLGQAGSHGVEENVNLHFHSLGHSLKPEVIRQGNDRPDNSVVVGVDADVTHKLFVNLEAAQRETLVFTSLLLMALDYSAPRADRHRSSLCRRFIVLPREWAQQSHRCKNCVAGAG
jgi:hypothetical protein